MARVPHVAVLIETSRGYGRGLLEGVARYVREQGPWSIYFKPHGLEEPPPAWLRNWKGDGILARIDNQDMARAVQGTGLPVVDLRGRLSDSGLPLIGLDNEAIARLAVDHLRERGFRQFAFCGLARGEFGPMDQRSDYFCQFLRQAGFDCQVFVPRRGRRRMATWEHEQQQLAGWLAHLPKPVGIMTCNDDRGQQLLDACRRAGVLVPDEVAVLGVDNDMVVCNLATPALSSIDVNPQRIGYAGAALLDRLMAGGRPPKKPIYLNFCSLVPRQSTDVLAIHDRELSTAVRFIREHACEGINVGNILQIVSLSRSVLERRFKKVIGRTPKAEILAVQMQRAKQLLTETDLSLEEIAQKTGFRTEKYFGDIFYRKAGLRAGAYRKRFRRLG